MRKKKSTHVQLMERPVLFKGEMVRAILDGRKTQTRRIIYGRSHDRIDEYIDATNYGVAKDFKFTAPSFCPYGVAGDRLWVRETFQVIDDPAAENPIRRGPNDERFVVDYKSDNPTRIMDSIPRNLPTARRWKPSIFMPRWASRITLEITNVRVERLQEITGEDAKAEGVSLWDTSTWLGEEENGRVTSYDPSTAHPGRPHFRITKRTAHATLWDSINGNGAWEKNPWVWVVEFKRIAP